MGAIRWQGIGAGGRGRRAGTWLALAAAAGLWALPAAAQDGRKLTFPATRDADVSTDDRSEMTMNFGTRPRMKLKGWKQYGLADFDVSRLAGMQIKEAYLSLKPAGGATVGANGGSDLRWLTVSTINQKWDEATVSFNEASRGVRWGDWPGSRIADMMLGNGNTLRFDGQLEPAGDRLRMKIDPRLVQALVAKAADGLMLMEGSCGWWANNYVSTREGGAPATLEVLTDGEDRMAPAAPTMLKVAPEPEFASASAGAIRITLTPLKEAFAYRVKVNGAEVARWQVPFAAAAGAPQSFPIQDLPPDAGVNVEVAVVDAAGNASPVAAAAGRTSPKMTVPVLPASPFRPAGGEPKTLGSARVWAFPEVTKVDPVTAELMFEPGGAEFKKRNPVWDGASGTIRLAAARGEIISFQVAVEGELKGCRIAVSPLKGPDTIAGSNVKLWRNWYVAGHSEYARPLEGAFDCPMGDNSIAGQKLQAITVDYAIPKSAKPGAFTGTVTLTAGESALALPLQVQVYDVVLPEEINFNPELNCYNDPGAPGSEQFIRNHRIAHYNRCVINRVPYNQSGGAAAGYVPKTDASGNPTDWSDFDRSLGGLFDGSWFKDNPRSGVPVPTFYLPLHEGWPLNFRAHYNPGCAVPASAKDTNARIRHHSLAKPLGDALDQPFKDAFVNATAGFVTHAAEKRWLRTQFHGYLNNKGDFGYTLWQFDEPMSAVDWMAINALAALFRQGIADPEVYTARWVQDLGSKGLAGLGRTRPTFLFRGDISRPAWQGNASDGLMSIMYGNNEHFEMNRLIRATRERAPMIVCTYGGCNDPKQSNWGSAAWCLQAYASHSDAVLPWQSLGNAGHLNSPNSEALILTDLGVASFRVHALRRGAQDCELLRLLQIRKGWSRGHIGMLVAQKIPLTSEFKQAFTDEASAASYRNLTSAGFCEMKEGVLQLLTAK